MTVNGESTPSPDQPLAFSRDAVVVRGGISEPSVLRKNAVQHHDDPANVSGDFAISVCCKDDLAAAELARLGAIPHPKIRETTVGALRDLGYDVVPDEPPPGHALITLPSLPTDTDYQRVSEVLSPPYPNPALEPNGA